MSEKLKEMMGKLEAQVEACEDQELAEKALRRALDFLAGAMSTAAVAQR